MGPVIVHSVLVLVGIRLGLYCVMRWRLLRMKQAIASTAARGWERFLLYSLPVIALLMAVQVVNSGVAIARLLGRSAL